MNDQFWFDGNSLRQQPVPITDYGGVKLVYTVNALRETGVRKFPYSRHRSKRVLKKLIKRHGSEYVWEPCIWKLPNSLVAHPSFRKMFDKSITAV